METRKIEQTAQQSGEKKTRTPHFFPNTSPEGFSGSSTSVRQTDQSDCQERIEAHFKSGERYRQAGRYQEALNEFYQLLGLDEQNTFALVSRGKTYEAMGKPKEASADYKKALTLDST